MDLTGTVWYTEENDAKMQRGTVKSMRKEFTAEAILEALNKHYVESIFITDGEGNVIFVNEEGARRCGAPREELMHKNVAQLVEEGVYDNSTSLIAIETKQDAVSQLTYQTADPSISHSIPVLDENGEVELVITTNMSVGHNKEWQEIITKERAAMARMQRELDYLRLKDHSKLVANSPAMKRVIQTIDAIAPTDSNVVILGESGTGKDMMAHFIHENSRRADQAFISINCAAIPEQLLESELFGYEAGAFTGALSKGKIGLFEAASGGTIFLDEIGDMPLALQSKLLRALENREIRRVGGVKNIPIDVRIICATNINLQNMVEEKQFREDLFYRLSVFVIQLPPLHERKEDIIPLAENFLESLNEKYDAHKTLAPVSVETMLNHRWPGNIRELRNVMERIFVVSPGDELIFTPTPTAGYGKESIERSVEYNLGDVKELKVFTEIAERWFIEKTLKECEGRVGETAEKLGIHRSALYRKLHKGK